MDEENERLQVLQEEYEAYLIGADDGNGRDVYTNERLMTFNEWLNN